MNASLTHSGGGYDVVPMFPINEALMKHAVFWHGTSFKVAWYLLLQAMGYNKTEIELAEGITTFARSVVIIRRQAMHRLLERMNHAITIASTNDEVLEALKADARYRPNNPTLGMLNFGTPFYQLHPFIFERLPSFFLYTLNMSVYGRSLAT
jgi:hypothetical protein